MINRTFCLFIIFLFIYCSDYRIIKILCSSRSIIQKKNKQDILSQINSKMKGTITSPQGNLYNFQLAKSHNKRLNFNLHIETWIDKKFGFLKISSQSIQGKQKFLKQKNSYFLKQFINLQHEFKFKHSISQILTLIPFEYYINLLKYISQVKFSWTFKPYQSNDKQKLIQQSNEQKSILSKIYKEVQFKITNALVIKSNKSIQNQKKINFYLQLFTIISIKIAQLFYRQTFKELLVDDFLLGEIYVILIYVFIGIQVSPKAFIVMKKKYLKQQTQMSKENSPDTRETFGMVKNNQNYTNKPKNSLNESSVSFFTSGKRSEVEKDKIKQNFLHKNNKNLSIQTENSVGERYLHPENIKIKSNKIICNNLNIKKLGIVKAKSINCQLPSQKKILMNCRSLQSPTFGTLNSFSQLSSSVNSRKKLKTKTSRQVQRYDNNFSNIEMLEKVRQQDESEFYDQIRQNLHVQPLPKLVKKRLNILQYDRLNETQNPKYIKQRLKVQDIYERRKFIKSTQISQSMKDHINNSQKKSTNLLKSIENILPIKSTKIKLGSAQASRNYLMCFKNPVQQQWQYEGITERGKTKKQSNSNKKNKYMNYDGEQNLTQRKIKCKKQSNDWQKYVKNLKQNVKQNQVLNINQIRKLKKKRLSNLPYDSNQCNQIIKDKNDMVFQHVLYKSKKFIEQNLQQNQSFICKEQQHCTKQKTFKAIPSFQELFEQKPLKQLNQLEQKQIQIQITNRLNKQNQYSDVLQGKVNQSNKYKENFSNFRNTFKLKKNLSKFQQSCKQRQILANHSIFDIRKGTQKFIENLAKKQKILT